MPKNFIKKFNSIEDLKAELDGLELLGRFVNTPKVLDVTSSKIIYEFIESGQPNWKSAATELKKLHQVKQLNFGYKQNNKIGEGIQINRESNCWKTFFLENRLDYQIGLLTNESLKRKMALIADSLKDSWFPNVKDACLCHGDFWSGNLMFDKNSLPVFIDPAVYYGDPMTDVAMARMFGGFDEIFYNTYGKSPNEMELHIYQLYHALNHINIFGSSYEGMAIRLINQIEESSSFM